MAATKEAKARTKPRSRPKKSKAERAEINRQKCAEKHGPAHGSKGNATRVSTPSSTG